MALNTPNNPQAGNTHQANQASGGTIRNAGSLGFAGGLNTLSAHSGSELTTSIAEGMKATLGNITAGPRPTVHVLDKELYHNLAYSAIIVETKVAGTVMYHVTLLTSSGRAPMTANEITTEVTNHARHPMNARISASTIFTPDDAIDRELHDVIAERLVSVYGNGIELSPVDGVVLGDATDPQLPARLASIAYNAVMAEAELTTSLKGDLNIKEAVSSAGNSMLKLDTYLTPTTKMDSLGAPVRTDFEVELNLSDFNNAQSSLNATNSRKTLSRTSGMIDVIPEHVTIPGMPGMPGSTVTALHPHIIITSNDVETPTPGFMMLGLISSIVMSQPNMWVSSLGARDGKATNNIGGLNMLTNMEGNQNKIGAILDMSPKTIKSPEEGYELIKRMVTLAPVVSYDIQSFGPQAAYSSILAAAAGPDRSIGNAAAADLVATCVQLTNGVFPSDFPLDNIFISNGIIVPTGTWADKTGERDIRDVDMAMILNQTQDVSLANEWVLSNIPHISGKDSFLTKVGVISRIIPDAKITGKAIRVTFTGDFINTLTTAATAAGLNVRYEPEIIFQDNMTFHGMGNYLQGAGVIDSSGFAHEATAAGVNLNTSWGNMGSGRYGQ